MGRMCQQDACRSLTQASQAILQDRHDGQAPEPEEGGHLDGANLEVRELLALRDEQPDMGEHDTHREAAAGPRI